MCYLTKILKHLQKSRMASHYLPVQWNAEKRRYDVALGLFVVGYLAIFVGAQRYFFPEGTIETLIIRASGTLAFLLLTIVLTIGPLCRVNDRFLPLLYNRRHLGVTTARKSRDFAALQMGLRNGVKRLLRQHRKSATAARMAAAIQQSRRVAAELRLVSRTPGRLRRYHRRQPPGSVEAGSPRTRQEALLGSPRPNRERQ